jgi:hypothetical protein
LRRALRSAERLRDAAIFFALVSVNTPRFKSSASLSRVTLCDQRLDFFAVADFLKVVLLPALFRHEQAGTRTVRERCSAWQSP